MTGESDPKPDPTPSPAPPRDLPGIFRDGGRLLFLLLLLAVLLRAAYTTDFLRHHPLRGLLHSDALLYHDWAMNIAGGDVLGAAEPYHHPPLYPHLLGALYAVAGPHPPVMIVLQSLAGLLTLVLGYGLARQITPRPAALGAAALLTLYFPPVMYETRLLPAALAALAAAAALFTLATARGAGRLLLGGLLLGLLCALRPNQLLAAGLLVPVVALRHRGAWTFHGALRRALPLLLGCAVPVLPFLLRNLAHGGEPVLLCDTGGINLYFAHHADGAASFRTTDLRFGEVKDQPRISRAIAEHETRRPLTWREVSDHFAAKALRFARDNPVAEARLMGLRLLAVVSNEEPCILYSPPAERSALAMARLLPLPFGVLIALAVAGVVLARFRSPRSPTPLLAAAFVAAQVLTVLLFFQYSRFRVVSLPGLVPFIALGLSGWTAGALPRARRIAALLAGAATLALSFLPAGPHAREQQAVGHVLLAEGHRVRGEFDAAHAQVDRALAQAPKLTRAHLERVHLLRAQGRYDEARATLEGLLPGDTGDPLLMAQLSEVLLRAETRDVPRAAAVARAAVEAAPFVPELRVTLAQALFEAEAWQEAADTLEPAQRLPGTTGEVGLLLGIAHLKLGNAAEAEPLLAEAARALPEDPRPWRALHQLYLGQARGADAERARRQAELREAEGRKP